MFVESWFFSVSYNKPLWGLTVCNQRQIYKSFGVNGGMATKPYYKIVCNYQGHPNYPYQNYPHKK